MDDNASVETKGLGYPVAKRWHFAPIVLAVAAWVAFKMAPEYGWRFFGFLDIGTYVSYRITIIFGVALAPLMVLFLLDRIYVRQGVRFIGDIDKTLMIFCLAAVLFLYLAAHGIGLVFGYSREQYMQDVYQHQETLFQMVVFLISLAVLVPIVEELVFRHFILSVIPFEKNIWLAVLTILASSVVFALLHQQYELWTTYATLFGFAVVAGVARVMSRGMLLPILLHAFAIAVALILNEAVQWLENAA